MWTPECEKSFKELKRRLITAPILVIPNNSEEFVIYSGAHFAWKKGFAYHSQNCPTGYQIQAIPTCCHWNYFNYTPCWKCIVNLLSQFQHVPRRPKSPNYYKSLDPATRSRLNSHFKNSHSPSPNSVSITESCTRPSHCTNNHRCIDDPCRHKYNPNNHLNS